MKTIIFFLSVYIGGWLAATGPEAPCKWVEAQIAVDGDTIRLADGQWLRLAAIDAPEIDHKNKVADPMGYQARAFLNKQIKGKRVCIALGSPKADGYGRLIAYVFDSQGAMINERIVAHGLGHVYPHAHQNRAYSQKLLGAQRKAMTQNIGIWRLRLAVKGPVIGNRRSRRFHLPTCPSAGKMAQKNRKRFGHVRAAYWAGHAPAACCLGSPLKKELKHRE